MYINGLGTRNVENLQTYVDSGRKTSNVNTFEDRMQKAVESWKAITKTGDGSEASDSVNSGEACCKQCYINGQLLSRMMTRSLFTQSSLSGLGLAGLSSYGIGGSALSAYSNPMGTFGSSIFSNIQI